MRALIWTLAIGATGLLSLETGRKIAIDRWKRFAEKLWEIYSFDREFPSEDRRRESMAGFQAGLIAFPAALLLAVAAMLILEAMVR